MHKKSVDDLLFLAHEFLTFFQTVRLALDVDHGAVVQDAIQDGGGNGDVGKDLIPLGESLVGGKNGGRLFVPSGNQLEEQVCALDIHGEIANLVNDEQPVLGQDFELVGQAVLEMGLFELLDELVAIHVVGGEAMLGRHKAQHGGQMSLAHTWRTEEYHVLPVFQEAHGGQLIDLPLVNGGLEREIEVDSCVTVNKM